MRYLIVAALAASSLAGCTSTPLDSLLPVAAENLPAACRAANRLWARYEFVEPFVPARYAIPARLAYAQAKPICDNAETIADAAAAYQQVLEAQAALQAAINNRRVPA